jgi:hypothetical protein
MTLRAFVREKASAPSPKFGKEIATNTPKKITGNRDSTA